MTPPKLTEAQIRRFWELCGWTPLPLGMWTHPNLRDAEGKPGAARIRPPDHTDLNAVFEALEWYIQHASLSYVLESSCAGYACSLFWEGENQTKYIQPAADIEKQPTKQDAIIRAVLASDRRSQ